MAFAPGRCCNGTYRSAGGRVPECRVPLAERATRRVLAGQPDRRAFIEQRCEGEELRVAPVDPRLVVAEGIGTPLELLAELGVDREPVRHGGDRRVELAKPGQRHGGLGLGRLLLRDRLRAAVELALAVIGPLAQGCLARRRGRAAPP